MTSGRSPNPDNTEQRSAVRLARLPWDALKRLAVFRAREDLRVAPEPPDVWVLWEPGPEPIDPVLEALRPIRGVRFFRQRGGFWYEAGKRLPVPDATVPAIETEGRPLSHVLFPEPVRPSPPWHDWRSAPLRLVRDDRPRPTSALVAPAEPLLDWAERVPTPEVEALAAARSGDRLLVLGQRLPAIPGAERYWGRRVLRPLGFRTSPDLPELAMIEAIGGDPSEDEGYALVDPEGAVAWIPQEVVRPLSRATLRLMTGGARSGRTADVSEESAS